LGWIFFKGFPRKFVTLKKGELWNFKKFSFSWFGFFPGYRILDAMNLNLKFTRQIP